MALQIWLPLNGNLDNQGVANATITAYGALANANGKIGQCYSFDGSDDYISINCPDINQTFGGGAHKFTMTFWVYHADSTRAILFGDYNLSGSIGFNVELTAGHRVRFYWNGSPDKSFSAETELTVSTWTHIAVVYDGAQILLYKDGVLSSDRWTGTLATKNKTNGIFYLGRDSRTGTTALNGRLNDFRIYDRALSAREVKELSRGLVVHYPLSRSFGNDNLLKEKIDSTKWYLWSSGTSFNDVTGNLREKVTDENGKVWAHVKQVPQSGYGGYSCQPSDNGIIIDPTKKYTISALAKAGSSTNAKLVFWCHWRSTEGGANLYQNQTFCDLTTTPKRVYAIWTPNPGSSSYTVDRINLMIGTYNCANNEVYFTDIKFEEGEVATPWIPNALDPIFNQMNIPISGSNSNLLTESTYGISHWTHINSNYTQVEQSGAKNTYICKQSVSGTWENVYSPAISVTSGQTYTLSCIYRVCTAFSLRSNSDNFGLCVQKAAPTNSNPSSNTIATISFGNAQTEYKRGSVTFTPSVSTIYLNIPGGYIADGQTGKVINVDYIKLEQGSVATPWNPDANVEYDVSGYQNNGTKSGALTYTSDTNIYNASTIFDGYVSISTTNPIPSPCKQFSVAGWVNLITGYALNNGYHIINWGGTYCRICISKDGYAVRVLLRDGSTNYMGQSVMTSSNLTSNKWNHYAITFNSGMIKIYINGTLDNTLTATINNVLFSTTNVSIGTYGSVELCKAKASDFRLYATALTADDVLELYNQGRTDAS